MRGHDEQPHHLFCYLCVSNSHDRLRPRLAARLIGPVEEREAVARERVAAPVCLEFPILSLHPGLRPRCVAPDVWPYYNEVRSHASLKGRTPSIFVGGHMVARAELNNVHWVSHCRDLVQLPVAA